jgi:hypothetical protein
MILEVTGHEVIELTDPYKMDVSSLKKVIEDQKQMPSVTTTPPSTSAPPWSIPQPMGPGTVGDWPDSPYTTGDPQTPHIWTKLQNTTRKWEGRDLPPVNETFVHGLANNVDPEKWEKNWS